MACALIALVTIAAAAATLLPSGDTAPRGHSVVKRQAEEFDGENGGPPGGQGQAPPGGEGFGGGNSGRNSTRKGRPGRGGMGGSCSSGRNQTSNGRRQGGGGRRGPPSSRLTDGTSQIVDTTVITRHSSTDTNLRTGVKQETSYEGVNKMKAVTESPDTENVDIS